jgi:hypothetical protein
MSNKSWNKLIPVDQKIREFSFNSNQGMDGNTEQVRVTLIRGFELFNTRPYHNYETWGDGYRIEVLKDNLVIATVEQEDLDDALEAMTITLSKKKAAGSKPDSPCQTENPE